MFALLSRIFYFIYNRLLIARDPAAYARRIGVKLGRNVHFYGATPGMFGTEPWLITIGDNVHIVSGCNFVNHDGGVLILRNRHPTLELTRPIAIGSNVYIGINCTILPGVTIGDNVIVGAGSIVAKDIPSNSVAAGVPARVIKPLEDYLAKALRESLGYGHMNAADKAAALKKHFNVD